MDIPKLCRKNANNKYLLVLHNFASSLPSIAGNESLYFVTMDKDELIKLTRNSENFSN